MDVRNRALALRHEILEAAEGENREGLKQAAEAIVSFFAGLVYSLGKVMNTGAPFGIAAVAAAGGGINGVSCLFGAAIGYLISGGLERGIRYLAAAVMVFTVSFAFVDSKIYRKSFFAPVTAGMVTLFTGVLAGFSSLSDISAVALVFLETALASGACFFFREAMSDEEPVTELSELRRSSAILISISLVAMSFGGIVVLRAVSIGRFAAIIFVMTAAFRNGMVSGCIAGTAFGVVMDISSGGAPFYTMAYAFSALISGILNRHGRLVFVISYVLSNAICVACAWSELTHVDALFEAFSAAVIFMLLPTGFLSKAGAMMQSEMRGSGESGLRRYVSRRVEKLASAYAGLYEIVRRNVEEPRNDNDSAKIFDRAADAVCVSCKDKNRCWNKEYMETLSALNDAFAGMNKRGRMLTSDIPSHFTEKCNNPEAFVTAVNCEMRASLYRKQFRETLKESRDTVWGQYGDMAEILSTVSHELGSPNGADHLAERRLIRYLRTLDIDADVAVYRDVRGRLRAVIESGSLLQLYRDKDYLNKLSSVVGIFVVKEEFLRSPGVSQSQLLSDARRAAAGLVEKSSGKAGKSRLPQSAAISISALLGSGVAVAIMKIFGL